MRIGVLSDIHANLVALEAVLADLGSADAIWHLGDVVGYGPEPDAVVARLDALGAIGVRGNHDAVVVGDEDASDFNPDARRAAEWTREVIDPAARAWLAALPSIREEGEQTLVHASPRDPTREYIVSTAIAGANLSTFTTRHCLHGHTHVPAVFRAEPDGRVSLETPVAGRPVRLDGERLLLNPGSVGQPRDRDPRAAYALLDTERAEWTLHRVPYEIALTQAAMRRHRLPTFLVERLAHGA